MSLEYHILQKFATGGISQLYLVMLPNGRKAVLRQLQVSKMFSIRLQRQFRYGVTVHKALSPHRNIAECYECGSRLLRPYELIEYVPGENIKSLLSNRSMLLAQYSLRILQEAARGLAWVHQRGYVHLDVKPENFLCTNNCSDCNGLMVKLIDFDTAREASDKGPRKQNGTPSYMAPEQFRRKIATQASDVFAFSVMAYQILTRANPFEGNTVKEKLHHQVSEKVLPKPPIERNPDIPEALNNAIMMGLTKRMEERIPNMSAWCKMAFPT